MPFLFVCQAAVPVQPAVVAAIGMERLSSLPDVRTANGCQMVIPPEEKGCLNSPCNKLIAICAAREALHANASNPPGHIHLIISTPATRAARAGGSRPFRRLNR